LYWLVSYPPHTCFVYFRGWAPAIKINVKNDYFFPNVYPPQNDHKICTNYCSFPIELPSLSLLKQFLTFDILSGQRSISAKQPQVRFIDSTKYVIVWTAGTKHLIFFLDLSFFLCVFLSLIIYSAMIYEWHNGVLFFTPPPLPSTFPHKESTH